MNDRYRDTVRLLLDITPHVFAGGGFALKGGTAINMFIRDMPRLSVDLDLVHVDAASDRDQALGDIRRRLDEIRAALTKRGFDAPPARPVGDESRLLVSRSGLTVKVEVNTVFRGTVLPPVRMDLCAAAETLFSRTLTVPALAVEEVYAGKLVAAMDRQHPRDLFDVMKLREAGGITALTRQTFVACLCGHNRPINELLTPNRIDIARAFENDFVGMTRRCGCGRSPADRGNRPVGTAGNRRWRHPSRRAGAVPARRGRRPGRPARPGESAHRAATGRGPRRRATRTSPCG
ncbi:MAG: nucleotidyl transferase AbiEii/AbiGii toxin family protein [Alphaproteobacteria bacterium]|nr:nucleotidyl transferase AbiEii/AbiGii toxin family protein [Alphaproteobacteria bacterium]